MEQFKKEWIRIAPEYTANGKRKRRTGARNAPIGIFEKAVSCVYVHRKAEISRQPGSGELPGGFTNTCEEALPLGQGRASLVQSN